MSPQGPTGACVTPALATEALVIPCRWTGGGGATFVRPFGSLAFMEDAHEGSENPLVWGPSGAPPCSSEEVSMLCPVGGHPTGGFSFLRWGWKDSLPGEALLFAFPFSSLSSWLASSVLKINSFVLLSRGAVGSSQGSSGSLLIPQPSPAACPACAASWSGSCSVPLTDF